MITANIIAFIVTVIGAINWGLVGIFNWNLVSAIFGAGRNLGSSIVYVLVFISAIWLVISCVIDRGLIRMSSDR